MKKIWIFLCLIVFVTSFSSAAKINIKTVPNQGIYLTPIKTTNDNFSIIPREFYVANNEGNINLDLDLEENYNLKIEFDSKEKYEKIFREDFNYKNPVNLEIFREYNIGVVDRFGSRALKNFIITGYSVYSNNQKVLIPVSSVFIGIILLLFFISIFNKNEKEEEKEEYDKNKKESKEVINELERKGTVEVIKNNNEITKEEVAEMKDRVKRIKDNNEFSQN